MQLSSAQCVSRVRRALGLALNSDAHTSIAIRAYARAAAPRKPLMQIDMIDGIIWPGYAWIFDSGSQIVNVGLGTELLAYKAQKRRLPEVLASYLSLLGEDFVFDQASVHSAPLPLASKLPPLAHPAQSAALIGNAASMINPLTGEGISYGMLLACCSGAPWPMRSGGARTSVLPHSAMRKTSGRASVLTSATM